MGAYDFNLLGQNNNFFQRNPLVDSLGFLLGPDGKWNTQIGTANFESMNATPDGKQNYWGTQLQNYYDNKFKLETPTFGFPQKKQQLGLGVDYAQQFRDSTQPQMDQMNLQVGQVLSTANDPAAQILGRNMIRDATQPPEFEQPLQNQGDHQGGQSSLPDVSNLTGTNINYGQQFLNAGTQLADQLIKTLGGKEGAVAAKGINAAGSTVNAVKNLRALNAASKAGVEGLGKAKAGNAMAIAGAGSDLATSFLPEKTEYNGPKGDITKTMDTVYDGISNAAMSFGPIGMMVGGAMKGGKLLGGVLNSIGGGTDGMTTTDAILGSSFLNLTPVGLINGFGGQKAETITKDEQAFETVGASYTGSNQSMNSALQKSGKKYGLFSNSARKKANEEIREAGRQQSIITNIADEATDRFDIMNSMSSINGNRRALAMRGGYNQSSIRVGKQGMIMQAKRIVSQYNLSKKKEKLQKGGTLDDSFEAYLKSLPDNLQNSDDYRVKDYWEFNGRPKNFGEAIAKGMFIFQDDGWHAYSVAMNPTTGDIEFMKSVNHPTHKMELDWYYSDNASEFRKEWDLEKTEPYYKYVKRKNSIPELVESPKKTRTLKELIEYAKKENPRFIQRMSEPLKFVEWEDDKGKHFGTHEMNYGEADGKIFIFPMIQEIDGNLVRYQDAKKAMFNALDNKNVLQVNNEDEAKLFTESEELPDGTFTGYKSGWADFFKQRPSKFQKGGSFNVINSMLLAAEPDAIEEFKEGGTIETTSFMMAMEPEDEIPEYKEGGSFNVIPEGALHARLHNMENADNLTKKGIPVVVEKEGGELEQQAEIEREEIIFRLEVTKKLEELAKDGSDEAAIEAGKLLVEEILNNTIDNTNRLL